MKIVRFRGTVKSKTIVIQASERLALVGFTLYAVFAPHSIAGAEIALSFVAIAWLVRTIATGSTGILRSRVDLPIVLFIIWTILSSFLSEEPRTSLAKLQSVCVVLLLYLARAFINRRTAVFLISLMIVSAVAGSLWSVISLVRGRGVVVQGIAPESPFRRIDVIPGDSVWRIGRSEVRSIADINGTLTGARPGEQLGVSIIRDGEHADLTGFVLSIEERARSNSSGLTGVAPTHRFRASGWTRHYETYSETLQILTQLALGMGLAGFARKTRYPWAQLALAAAALLTAGVALTAMRTVLVALVVGALFVIWRAAGQRIRIIAAAALLFVVVLGIFSVWRTRTSGALLLNDASASLRSQVAKAGAARILMHPFFGVGMDSVKTHWHEWGFPGNAIIHLHSTPLELAFERGLPALFFWCWIMVSFLRLTWKAEKRFEVSADWATYGILLGALGATIGFLASSLVNYNFGDGEVALVFWFVMGTAIAVSQTKPEEEDRDKVLKPVSISRTSVSAASQ
jgi:O-Antigen ligase/PDZ domain